MDEISVTIGTGPKTGVHGVVAHPYGWTSPAVGHARAPAPGVHAMSRRSALVIRVLQAVATSPGSGSRARTWPAVLVVSGAHPCGVGQSGSRPCPGGCRCTWYVPEVDTGDPSPPSCCDESGVRELSPDLTGSARRVLGPSLRESQSGGAPSSNVFQREGTIQQ